MDPSSRPTVPGAARATLLVMAVALATTSLAQSGSGAMDDLTTQGKRCTERFGYDPERQSGLGEYEIAPGERDWRDCMYNWLRTEVIPNTTIPETYRELIAYDRMMTDRIEQKKMTRAQRLARIERLIEDALEREQNVVAEGSRQKTEQEQDELARDRDRLVKMREDAVRMKRIESMMAR